MLNVMHEVVLECLLSHVIVTHDQLLCMHNIHSLSMVHVVSLSQFDLLTHVYPLFIDSFY